MALANSTLLPLSPSAIRDCQRCALHLTCHRPVPYLPVDDVGGVMIVAEAPGQMEDSIGKPLVGPTGKDTQRLVRRYLSLEFYECWVTNLVKCRPPENRDPTPEEIHTCSYWLTEEITTFLPELIIAVGALASRWFFPDIDMAAEFGIPYRWHGTTVVCVYHPARALHKPADGRLVERGFELIKEMWVDER